MNLLDNSDFAKRCREAWKKSPAYRAMHGLDEQINAAPQEPGQATTGKPISSGQSNPAAAAPIEYSPDLSLEDLERYLDGLMEP